MIQKLKVTLMFIIRKTNFRPMVKQHPDFFSSGNAVYPALKNYASNSDGHQVLRIKIEKSM